MTQFMDVQRARAEFVVSERALWLHAQRGNLPFRREGTLREYEAAALALLFPRRGVATSSMKLGERLGGDVAQDEIANAPRLRARALRRAASPRVLALAKEA